MTERQPATRTGDGSGRRVRVVVVDDQTLVRQGISGLLALSDEIEVCGEGTNGDDALDLVAAGGFDVMLLDLRMPGRDGISVLRTLQERRQQLPVLVLTTFDDGALALQALTAGARGYLLKAVGLDQLVAGIKALAVGGTFLQPGLTDRLVEAAGERDKPGVGGIEKPEPLTPREVEVLRLVAAGYDNGEISEVLHLARGTVKNHLSAVFFKLGVHDRTRAVLRALDLGLLDGGR
jgi:DNA-binding NarL/FixJ family response regulator